VKKAQKIVLLFFFASSAPLRETFLVLACLGYVNGVEYAQNNDTSCGV